MLRSFLCPFWSHLIKSVAGSSLVYEPTGRNTRQAAQCTESENLLDAHSIEHAASEVGKPFNRLLTLGTRTIPASGLLIAVIRPLLYLCHGEIYHRSIRVSDSLGIAATCVRSSIQLQAINQPLHLVIFRSTHRKSIIMRLLVACCALLGLVSSTVAQKFAFAHVVVGNTAAHSQDTWAQDITLARNTGLDAFVLNIAYPDPNIYVQGQSFSNS